MNDEWNNDRDNDNGRDDAFDEKLNKELMASAWQLRTEIDPARDLWPGIAESITESRTDELPNRRGGPATWSRVFAQAAAVVLLVAGSSALTYLAVKPSGETTVSVSQDLLFEQASFGGRYNLGADYQLARGNLASRLDQSLSRLSPQARLEVEENLQAIRESIKEINAALSDDPDNELLQGLLLKTYREELDVMRRVDGLVTNAMLRKDI